MNFFSFAVVMIAAVAADVSHLPKNDYLPAVKEANPAAPAAPVDPVPTNEYLPPGEKIDPAPLEPIPGHELTNDGYHYKTQRRVVYRRSRRDVSHLPLNEYLPPPIQNVVCPVTSNNEYLPPVQKVAPVAPALVEVAPAHELADDGYHYKTQRRVFYRRNRRDANHLPSNEYLPSVPEAVSVDVAPIREVSNTVIDEALPAHELNDDGYHYKAQRRIVYRRNRRDVSHLPSNENMSANEYLPPVQEVAPVLDVPVQKDAYVEEPVPAHELADDGYHYKTQRRVVYRRNRRDVNNLPSNEYLPPVKQDVTSLHVATNEYLPPIQQYEPLPAHKLSDDGYHYKTHRRVVFRRY